MFTFIFLLILASLSFGVTLTLKNSSKGNSNETAMRGLFRWFGIPLTILFTAFAVLSTSMLFVDKNTIEIFNKRIMGDQLSNGAIIALNDEMGPQPWIKREGVHIMPFVSFVYDTETVNLVTIPQNKVGILSTKDGMSLSKDEFIAPNWKDSVPAYARMKLENNTTKLSKEDRLYYERSAMLTPDDIESRMLDTEFFLRNGGKKGPQYNVLKPGKYAINSHLFDVQLGNATVINAGHVGVVTSKVGKIYSDIKREAVNGEIVASLVPKGYIGVWSETLTTGNYYFNPLALQIQSEDVRAQVWNYAGGYTQREVSIEIEDDGKITQTIIPHSEIVVPKNAADKAISVKTKDKYTVYIEARMQIQPDPRAAAGIVAGIGSLAMVEDKVVTPAVRAVLRNLGQKYNAVDFVDKRQEIELEFSKAMILRTANAGVPAKEVFFGNIDLPPAVLVPQKIKELSIKMRYAYVQQQATYKQLIKTNETKATADQQPTLVKAKILDQQAGYQASARQKEGIGEQKYLTAVAKGQKSQVDVLGEEKTVQLQIVKEVMVMCKARPEVCAANPMFYINGSGEAGGMNGTAALLKVKELMAIGSAAQTKAK